MELDLVKILSQSFSFCLWTAFILCFQVAKREEAIHKLKIEKLSLQEQQQKAEDNVSTPPAIFIHLYI